ncbi:MerR family transcriptional regulator [Mycolicibacterium goodii]|uniref:MerR family transcriptional regulator n=1 Tax=Mycolicibacterium goodii TaxID=134601 RepID=A0ABS6HH75_MYCGD|nr:MerR family transcriptional regulator [Mycolicibacterium goodii]OKH65939.1 MerR family transcriptional regulator [Mycobacterium sp. SWH-M5]MBU8820911.1 MerR family transcriptional regulator [Mycolicibacterium goodii]MBU8821696.1 MerR family transcriptional regulator [Mycolicibacterium goodii]MBU8831726.1 MerR family transcriptional regulator [Mycolicibacterium goodii]MBU8836688.1 MerR family transcriptional regulator [Mycolicibacterium goodii]
MSDTDAELLQIGEVATRTELSIKTIRHYDEVGLVVPSVRSAGGFRLYTGHDVRRLLAIRRMKPLGFTLDEMGRLLDALAVLDNPAADAAERAQAAEVVADCHTRAQQACDRLARHLGYAREFTEQLAKLRR